MITTNQLDLMYGTLLNKIKLPVLGIKDTDMNSGVTTFTTTQDAFSLNDPGVWLKHIDANLTSQDNENGFIIRTVISYTAALEMSKDYLYGIELLSVIKNYMLTKAAYRCNLYSCDKVSFARPSIPSTFFRELEHHAGFELRLYVQYKKVSLD